ncbi:MAG: hypothetical protein JSU67_02820, partial [Gammaproteobacteria bacterium]
MRPVLISVSLALILGIAIGAMLPERSALPPAPEPAAAGSASEAAQAPAEPIPARQAANTEIEQLKRLLRDEIRAREILAQRLEALNRRVAAIDSGKSGPPASADSQNSADDYLDQAAAGERQWFDQQALLDSGMDDIQVQQLKLFFETLEMERLYLRDRAARESWERGRLREEMQSLQDREETLKQELGEDGYDAYLYASGQT